MSQNRPTIRNCVWHVLDTADEETLKGMLAISKLGKEYLEIQDEKQKSNIRNTLSKGLNRAQLIEAIIENMESAITEGFGIMDVFKDMDLYPKQLQHCIEVLTKGLEKKAEELGDRKWKRSLKTTRNKYRSISLTCEVVEELEEVIIFLLLDSYSRTLPEEERDQLIKNIATELNRLSGEDEDKIASVLKHNGLLALRQSGIFNPSILAPVVIGSFFISFAPGILAPAFGPIISWFILRSLPGILAPALGPMAGWFATRAATRMLGSVFGPVGWAMLGASLFSLASKTLNPRRYDRYIPLVVYIHILRREKEYLQALKERLKALPE